MSAIRRFVIGPFATGGLPRIHRCVKIYREASRDEPADQLIAFRSPASPLDLYQLLASSFARKVPSVCVLRLGFEALRSRRGKLPWSRVLGFTDPFECQTAIQGSAVEILPTSRGTFHAEITQIRMNKVWMQRFNVALPQISTVTISPERKVVGFLSEGSSHLKHCGIEVEPGDMLVAGDGVLHQRSERGYYYATMSVPADDFPDLCRTVIGRELLDQPRTSIVRPNPALMSRLLSLHKAIGRLAHDTAEVLLIPEVLRAMENELTHLMVRCLAEGVGERPTTGRHRHDAIIAQFEEFLEANPDRAIYLTEMCAAIGVAERTLRACCEDNLGMGPIRFLTLRRMHLARRALHGADHTKATVTQIVTDHGFWELGRFSVAYRALFGESPSETLRRPADYRAPPQRSSLSILRP
jgi:AraC-like DNA-binding protein